MKTVLLFIDQLFPCLPHQIYGPMKSITTHTLHGDSQPSTQPFYQLSLEILNVLSLGEEF
jgi:hypothetical protein